MGIGGMPGMITAECLECSAGGNWGYARDDYC